MDERWHNIAVDYTAFCLFGGPSAKQLENLDELIQNNITIVINNGIQVYPNATMFLSADNRPVRKYCEALSGSFKLFHKHGSQQTEIKYDGQLLNRHDIIKIIISQTLSTSNYNREIGQIHHSYAIEYAKKLPNSWVATMFAFDPHGSTYQTLSKPNQFLTLADPVIMHTYGTNPHTLYPAGNSGSLVLQLLYYMGFNKIIFAGFGDIGFSQGTNTGETSRTTSKGKISIHAQHAMQVHAAKWGSRAKILTGGELIRPFGFQSADRSELYTNPNKKEEFLNKIYTL